MKQTHARSAALLSVLLTGCTAALPNIEVFSQRPFRNTDGDDNWHFTGGGEAWRGLRAQFDRCERDLEQLRSLYYTQLTTVRVFNALSATSALSGGGTVLPAVFQAAGVGSATNTILGTAGALFSAAGAVTFSVLAGQQDPATPRAQFERMLLAHRTARARYDDVLFCEDLLAEQPAVLSAPAQEDPPALRQARASFESVCSELASPLQAPSTRGAVSPATLAERQELSRATLSPSRQFRQLSLYLQSYCALTIPGLDALAQRRR